MKLWRYGHTIERLGQRYRLDGMLGSGGMAEVCLAWDEREQREVALKILKSDDLDQETLNRFMKEAGQIVAWQHPHILRIYDQMQIELVDVAQGSVLFYIAMEYARGGDLQKRLTPGKPFPLSASFALFRQLCDAVQYAHEHGVIHRDLKPLNILFRRPAKGPEEVVLSDFGLAVQADASHHTFARGGTLAYMAPEQLQGHALPASDIFALGVILYQLCTGRLPFRRSIHDLMWVNDQPIPTRPSLLNGELPRGLDEPILCALQDRPTERYHSAREFWDTVHLALLSNARTFPALADEHWSQAGTTWPFEKLDLQASSGPLAAVMEPMQEGPEFSPGSLREKQKASPERSFGLSLPTHSIPGLPNSARGFADEPDEELALPVDDEATVDASSSSLRRDPQTARSLRGDDFEASSSFTQERFTAGNSRLRTRQFGESQQGQQTLDDTLARSLLRARQASGLPVGARLTRDLSAVSQTRATRPPSSNPPARRQPTLPPLKVPRGRAPRRPWPVVPVVTTLALIALVCAIILAAGAQGSLLRLLGVPATTITLTPQSHLEQDTYLLTAQPGATTDSTTRHIPARLLSLTSQPQSATVNASGAVPGKRATGQLTFINDGSTAITINSAIITDNNGIQVSFQGPISVPAVPPSSVVVTGFAVNPGAASNIPVLDIVKPCCAANIVVKNTTAFTGGQDAQANSVVQQKDIDGAANNLANQLQPNMQSGLSKQVGSNERVVDGTLACQPQVSANQQAGDVVHSVTVQVTETCQEEVYDDGAARQLAGSLLSARVTGDPTLGTAYRLSGKLSTNVLNVNVTDAAGDVALSVQVSGTWAYYLSAARLHQLATLVAGKSQSEARALLLQQAGIMDAQFHPTGNLPDNVDEITMRVA